MDIVSTMLLGVAVAVFGAAMIYAVISDLRTFQIPNGVSVLIAVSFLVAAAASSFPWPAMLGNVVTGLAVLAVGFGLFAAGWFGAGDVKLMSAISLWLGWPLVVHYLVYMVVAGGVLSLTLIVFRRYPLYGGLAGTRWIERLHTKKKDVPYAVAIAMTALYFLPRVPLAGAVFAL